MSDVMVLYILISSVIFLAVALLHLVRILKRWRVEIGPRSVPMAASWIGLFAGTLLALWGLSIAL